MDSLAGALGPLVDTRPHPPRIYADANVPAGVVDHMRRRLGWDVFFVLEHDGLRRAPDREHFRLARRLRRTLVTLDRDYLDDDRFPPVESGGLVVLVAPEERALLVLAERLDGMLRAGGSAPPFAGRKLRLEFGPA
ncbi:MAG TPA: DUF5615 family PIN-like protein [Vicinamibacterales bacterium]|nr:DUF5615 family PIN-like protein [Vicinamibacterales bacterium]